MCLQLCNNFYNYMYASVCVCVSHLILQSIVQGECVRVSA